MGIYGHIFDNCRIDLQSNIVEESVKLSDTEKEQQKLYYDAKKLSNAHKFTEANKIIRSMKTVKDERDYKTWAKSYMERRKAEVEFENKSKEDKKEIEKIQKDIKKKAIIDTTEKGLNGTADLSSGVLMFIFPDKAHVAAVKYMNGGLKDIIKACTDGFRIAFNVFETEKGFEVIAK